MATTNIPTLVDVDATAAGAIERLQRLLACPPIELSVAGGGLGEPHRIHQARLLLVERNELAECAHLLKAYAGPLEDVHWELQRHGGGHRPAERTRNAFAWRSMRAVIESRAIDHKDTAKLRASLVRIAALAIAQIQALDATTAAAADG